MDSKEEVLKVYPEAYEYHHRSKTEIRRPRTEQDPPALVNYMFLSGEQWTQKAAWDEAARRLMKI